ncbi:MAG: hypothetical protein ABWY47_02610 [Xanthobacteraceae bacterium]
MSTPPGKPVDPVDLGAYKSRERSEPHPSETENQPVRSPYAPKHASPLAPEQPREPASREHFQEKWEPVFRPKMRPTKEAGAHSVSGETQSAPERPAKPAAERHAFSPAAERHAFSTADRRAPDIDGPRLGPDAGPGAGRVSAPPLFGEQEPPDHAPAAAFEARRAEYPAHPEAPLQPAESGGSRRPERPAVQRGDEIMSELDLERLEASLRWLQRQETATRLSRGTHPFREATLAPHAPHALRAGGERSGELHRPPLSLEPQRLAPPPLTSRGDNLRGPLRILMASCVAAPFLYYFFATGSAPPAGPAPAPKLASVDSRLVVAPPARPSGAREAAPAPAPADEPRTPGESEAPPPTAEPLPATRLPEREAVAMLPPDPAGAQAAPASLRALDPEEIKLLIKQGEQFVATGDLVTARTVLQRAAQAGDATAAVALGATYDPTVLTRLGVVGMGGADVEQARRWYQQAESLGSAEATKQLRVLAGR